MNELHIPSYNPSAQIGCMCVSETFTLESTSQVFDLYTCDGVWRLPHKIWLVELNSQCQSRFVFNTNYNQFTLLTCKPNQNEHALLNGMPAPYGCKLQVSATGVIGQTVTAKAYMQVGGALT